MVNSNLPVCMDGECKPNVALVKVERLLNVSVGHFLKE